MIVIDNFIRDYSLLERIGEDDTFFSKNGEFMWWDGWWNSPADTLKKELIQYIWGENSPMDSYEIGGFEYWTGQYGEGHKDAELKRHFDKDEYLWNTEKVLSQPMIGTVFYPFEEDIDGGFLEIESSENGDVERIKPKWNRLVIFAAGRYPHRVTPVTRGTRSAIAINLWYDAPKGLEAGEIILE
jgi:hypothetical protein